MSMQGRVSRGLSGVVLVAMLAAPACGEVPPSGGGGSGGAPGSGGRSSPGSGGTGAGGRGGSAGSAGVGSGGLAGGGTGGAPWGSGGSGGSGGGRSGAGGAAGGGAGASGGAGAGQIGGAGGIGGAAGTAGSAGTGGAAATGGAAGGAVVPSWDWVGVIGTGQSLAVGGHGNVPAEPIGATQQRYGNLKLSLGSAGVPPFDPANPALSMVALVEPLRAIATGYPSPYPRNMYGESSHTAMADQITTLARAAAAGRDYVTVHTEVGEAGQPLAVLQKDAPDTGTTGRAYAASLFEAAAISRLARAAGKSYGVGAVIIIHGETDTGSTYESELVKLWSSYGADLPRLTGQTVKIPMLVSQQSSSPSTAGSRSAAALAQWTVGLAHPGDIICIGPKYQYPYVSDTLHLTNNGYERLGEKLGQVFFARAVEGRDWRPLQPTAVERSGRVITVSFHVPVPPLAWDDTLPRPHQSAFTEWSAGRGFELRSGESRIAVSGVAIAGDTVRITSATDLPASGLMVGYASTADGVIRPRGTARWGQLRDSDPFVGSMTRAPQPNHCVAFELPVP